MADGSNLIVGSDANAAWQANNQSDARTQLVRDGTVTRLAFLLTNRNGGGLRAIASGTGAGVRGDSTDGAGVAGISTNGIGVQGGARVSGASAGNVGVQGNTPYGTGVEGNATDGLGVEGNSLNGDGVWGTSTRGTGVYGESINGVGVEGFAPQKPGVRGGSQDGAGVLGDSDRGPGVYGVGRTSDGVYGISGPRRGVVGVSTSDAGVAGASTNRVGVLGISGALTGVRGEGPANGVEGVSPNGRGVQGTSGGGDGVFGISTSGRGVRGNSLRGAGVEGVSFEGSGVIGITQRQRQSGEGQFATNAGVRGISMLDQFGVHGMSLGARVFRAGGAIGITGAGVVADGFSGTALLARVTGGPRGIGVAGAFSGEVVVDGNFTVFSGAKSAAVRHPDGSYRRMYTMESPESYFEDFGRARLVRGKARVRLQRDFAALIRRGDYYVFLTPEGPGPAPYVSRRTGTQFEVRSTDERSAMPFCYRIVGKRRDIEGRRLERVRRPDLGRPMSAASLRLARLRRPAVAEISEEIRLPAPIEMPDLARLPKRPRRKLNAGKRADRRQRSARTTT